MNTKIIGHRGAAGLELENTATSLRRAMSLGVDAVEIDVRVSSDGKLVLCHDADLERISGDPRKVNQLTLRQIQSVKLLDGSKILTLAQALRILGDTPVIIELKDNDSAHALLRTLTKFPKAQPTVASFKLSELMLVRSLDPDLHLYVLEHTKPLETIQLASALKLNGIGLNYWLVNPLTYWFAKRKKLQIYAYTVNSKFRARFISWLYPTVQICTDHPQWFIKRYRRRLKLKAKKS